MGKSILVVYPHNFFKRQMGIDTRYHQLIRYFKIRNFEVDLFSLKNFITSWDNQDMNQENLLDKIYFYDFSRSRNPKQKKPKSRRKRSGSLPPPISFSELPDYAFKGMKDQFNEIISRKDYDFILISYVYWAALIESKKTKLGEIVLDLSDFTTLNLFDMAEGRINIGKLIAEEIRRINLFDKVICISADEFSFFSQFCPRPNFYFIPIFMKENPVEANRNDKFDLIFIGSDNPFNQKGMAWFFANVYPKLPDSLKILIVGKITAHIPKLDNVTSVPFINDVKEVYQNSKISICPLLGGTGMKIKVVEGLSFGLPVVTTSKGVSGLPKKASNGCLIANEATDFAQKICRLIEDEDFYQEQSRNSRLFFRENFEESRVYQELDGIF